MATKPIPKKEIFVAAKKPRAPVPSKVVRAPAAARAKAIALTRGERMCKFIEKYIIVPEGALVGKPMVLLPEQRDFIHRVYDNIATDGRLITRRAILSIARKNGKSGMISALLGGHLIGPEARPNASLYSAARSREQAGIVFKYLSKALRLNPQLEGMVQITDSGKRIVGLRHNAEYKALSAEATTAHGLSPALTIHDELGQVVGPNDALYDALETAGGAQSEPLSLIISTQAANDADLLSTLIDDMTRFPQPENVCALYAATREDDIFDPRVWARVNFALGIFRSEKEFLEAAERAKRMPSFEATFRNLYLNMRIALTQLFVSPNVWKENGALVDEDLFTSGEPVHLGMDLSARVDLTAVVAAVVHPNTGHVHIKPWVFTPADGIMERVMRDKAPYQQWVEEGYMFATSGRIIDYEQVAGFMMSETADMNIASISFDRWRIDLMKKAARDVGWSQVDTDSFPWLEVGQGFKDMSPRLETFESVLLNRNMHHGLHPLLVLGASNAIATRDPAGNRKLDKSKASARIDSLVAAVMAVHAAVAPHEGETDEITADDFLI